MRRTNNYIETSPSFAGLVSSTDCLDGDGQVENKDQAWRGGNRYWRAQQQ